jgi:tetratricopeptide (TPR) repeat protein
MRHRIERFTVAVVVSACLVAVVHAAGATTADVLRRAMAYQYQIRGGQTDIVPEYVAMLEEATKNEPENAEVWYAMGIAYLAKGAILKGPAALDRALQLNPDHPEALAVRGGIRTMMGSFMQAPELTARGVAEMNRAIAIAPASRRARLARAFLGSNVPDAMRNQTAEAEDLDFLITVAKGTRAGDYIRIMRGDLAAETGSSDLAREQYEMVVKSASPASTEAASRLAALADGGVPAADVKKLRQQAGANCVMCHGK